MTTDEARYVLAHPEMYDEATQRYAREIVANADRQGAARE